MIRVLQVLSTGADFQSNRCAHTIARDCGADFSIAIQTIGRGGAWRNVPFAVSGLRGQEIDIVHAWDLPSLTAVAWAATSRVVFTPSQFPSRRSAKWLRAIMAVRDVQIVCTSTSVWRAWVRHGVLADNCQLIRPGVEFGRARRRRDPALRAALGLSDEDHVLLAVGESTRAARHDHAVWAASILHVMDRQQKLLLWGRGDGWRKAERLAKRVGHAELCVVAEQRLGRALEFEELLPAADMALIAADGPIAPLPVAICMGAGLPIVATVTPVVSEMLEDRHTAYMTPPRATRAMAQRIRDLRGASDAQRSIADRARSEAYDYFAHTRFIDRHRELYLQYVAGEPVRLDDEPGVVRPGVGSG
jgi:glycosyltransferase involved in cell wall biosynthesis